MSGKPIDFDGQMFDGQMITPAQPIRCFADLPDIVILEIPPVEYIVPALGIARNTITLWTGPDGDGKTYLAQKMALAVARGSEFLGMACQHSPVLYIDLENPGFVVQDRMRALMEGASAPDTLRFWGTWLEIDQQPPQVGSELLLTICKETKPILIVDPFRYFHKAEENDSTAMAGVMQYLRACAAYGAAVVILHHPSKAEGSTGRGSSAIRGACDLAMLHTLEKESGLITLKLDKNRLGARRTITVRADFEEGEFELTDAPFVTRRNDELIRLEKIIKSDPGISQNGIAKQSGMKKQRLVRLLEEGKGTRWITQKGQHNSICYLPFGNKDLHISSENSFPAVPVVPAFGNKDLADVWNKSNPERSGSCSLVPSLLEGNRGTASREGDKLPACSKCGSFALYAQPDGGHKCMTCERRW